MKKSKFSTPKEAIFRYQVISIVLTREAAVTLLSRWHNLGVPVSCSVTQLPFLKASQGYETIFFLLTSTFYSPKNVPFRSRLGERPEQNTFCKLGGRTVPRILKRK